MIQQLYFLVYIPKKNGKQNLEKLLVHPCFIALFTIAKMWKQPKCPSLDERISKVW